MIQRTLRYVATAVTLAVLATLAPASPTQAALPGPSVQTATRPTYPFTLASSFKVSYEAFLGSELADGGKPAYVQVRVSKTPLTSTSRRSWTRPEHLQHVGLTSTWRTGQITVGLNQGQASCVGARAVDVAGRVGPWGYTTCIARFFDDNQLERKGAVKTVRAKRFWHGVASELDGGGQLILRHVPPGSDVWVLGRPAPYNTVADWGSTPRIIGMNSTGTRQIVLGQNGGINVNHRSMWNASMRTQRLGPVWLRRDRDGTFPIEGIVVIPPWARSSA